MELRFAELRFTPSEARLMLERLVPDLSESELDDSASYTDGWAAGVQLTALAARSALVQPSPISLLSEAQLLTEDYVWHEVLASGDADVVEVLLQISVVDRVNTSLATAITGRRNVRDLLAPGRGPGPVRASARRRWLVQDPSAGPRGVAERAREAVEASRVSRARGALVRGLR